MKINRSWILKKAAALLTALMLLFSALPAGVAASADWDQMVITVSWYDAVTGEYCSVDATPVTEAEGSFWILLPPEAPHEGLTITAVHSMHTYVYDANVPAELVTDAGQYLDGSTFMPFMVTDAETGDMQVFNLYFSTVTDQPVIGDPAEIARQAAEEEAARIAAEEEAARIAAEQEAAQRAAEEEAARIAAEQEAARIAAEQEAAQRAAEEEAARIAAEQEAARIAAEQKAAEEEAARIATEQEAARIAAEQKAAEEEAARIAAEQEAARIAAEQKAAEEETARITAEQEAARIAAEQKAAEEEAARIAAEQEAAQKAAEEEAARIAAEQEAARIAAEEEAARKAAEEKEERTIREGEMINRYGLTKTGKLAFRTKPGKEGDVIVRLDSNERVYLIRADFNDAGESWAYVEYNGNRGYIKTEFLDLMTKAESDAWNSVQTTPAPLYTEDDIASIAAQAEADRKAEEEAEAEAARIAAEQEAAQKAAEEEAARIAAEQEAAQKAAEEEAARIAAEQEAAQKAAEEEAARIAAEQEAARKAAEEAAKVSEIPTDAPEMPVGTIINRYGVTNAKVNFRQGPGTNEHKMDELAVGTYVYLIYTEPGGDNELWTLVDANGQRGYLMSKFINVLTQEDSDAYNYAQAVPAPAYTLEDIFPAEKPEAPVTSETAGNDEPAPAPVNEPSEPEPAAGNEQPQTPAEEKTDPPAPTAAPVIREGEMINRYGLTNAGKLAFREQPDADGKLITRLDKDAQVYVLYADFNDAGDSWTYVERYGQRGYIKTEYLNLLTEEDSAALNPGATPPPVYTEEELFPTAVPTQVPAPTEAPTEEPAPTDTPTQVPTETPAPEIPVGEMINRYGRTNSKVFFRKEASTNSKSQGELKKNTSVYLIYTQENSLGETWTYAMVNGKTGYIMTTYLDMLTAEDSALLESKYTPAPVFVLEDIFPTPVPTEVVTIEATEEPTVPPTEVPTATPTATPTEAPTETPTETPTEVPTATPTEAPTETPTEAPTEVPTGTPTEVPTETPTEVPTETPTEAPTETPTEAPTEAPTATPTEAPTETPTEAPTEAPTEVPTEAPTETPTEAPTEAPTNTPVPAPTEEPYQRVGYAITIGDGVPVREWPMFASSITDSLPANKIVYVTGQVYQDAIAWSVAEYDGKWGYVRADLLRMIPEEEMKAYAAVIQNTTTPAPDVTPVPYVYNADEMSCYGYVTTDAVNFRTEPSSSSRRIRLMKKYALFIVYGTVQADGETWYKVSYNNQEGYLNGKYFKQMTVGEAEEFLSSPKYQEGLANNSEQQSSSTSPVTTGSPTGVVSAEDQKVSEWVNPATGSTVSYEPFDPFATPAPLAENELEKNEFVSSLISQLQAGELKQEELQTELEKFYKDAADPEGSVSKAMAYIQEKLGLQTEAPTEEPGEQPTEEVPEYPQEQSSGGAAGWIIALILLAAAGGGGYYWYIRTQQKREAAQRIAKQKVAKQQKAMTGKEGAVKPSGPVSAQNAARVRTGNYTGGGTAKPKATPSSPSGTQNAKPYGTGSKNPYGRYSASDTDEEASYTASFKPNAGKERAVRKDKPDENKPDENKPEA